MGMSQLPEEEHHQVHNCFVVLADMGDMVPEASGLVASPNGASTGSSGAQQPSMPGLGSRENPFNPFSLGPGGMPPFVFGSIVNPGQDLGVFWGPARHSQPGQPSASATQPTFASFNMGQSLLFRMAPPGMAPVTEANESLTASNRRSDAPVPSVSLFSYTSFAAAQLSNALLTQLTHALPAYFFSTGGPALAPPTAPQHHRRGTFSVGTFVGRP